IVAAGTVMWAAGAFGAALVSWVPHVADVLRFFGVSVERPNVALAVLLGLGASCLGSFMLIRPHAGIKWYNMVMALLATLLYGGLGYSIFRYHNAVGSMGPKYISEWLPSEQMTIWLAALAGAAALIIVLAMPNFKLLVARSRVMRAGWVDRQMFW